MTKLRIVFALLVLLGVGTVLAYRGEFLNLPQLPDIQLPDVNREAQNAVSRVVKEIQKEISMPPPLRALREAPLSVLTQPGVIQWTNAARLENGFAALTENLTLDRAATLKMGDMFEKQYFAHVSPGGTGPIHWLESANYGYIASGENLAIGNFEDDQTLVQAWMDSPGHRANILNGRYTEIGVAVGESEFSAEGGSASGGEGEITWIAVQIFGRPLSSCPRVDENLRVQIDVNQNQLSQWESDLAVLRAEIEVAKPRRREEYEEYNRKVEEYNSLVAEYNALIEETKGFIAAYNTQVNAFNICAAG